MLECVLKYAESDSELRRLLGKAQEYADIYLMAKNRQKGCDGMGELATMREEFRNVIDKLIQYCKEQKYISEVMSYDIDSIADERERL